MAYRARDVLLTGLKNAYALEEQAADITANQARRLTDYPELRQRVEQHRQETLGQRDRLGRCLERMGEKPSALKDAAMKLMGNMQAMMHATADDEVLKATFNDTAFEHYEIAAYKSLIVLAEQCGESDVAAVCRENLREEEDMADFLDSNVERITLAYLAQATSGEESKTGVM